MERDPRRFLGYIDAEHHASLLYRTLANLTDGDRREALLELAALEDEHAAYWADKLRAAGIEPPPPPTELDLHDRRLVQRARDFGIDAVAAHLAAQEYADAGVYDDDPDAPASMTRDEREHEVVLRGIANREAARAAERSARLEMPDLSGMPTMDAEGLPHSMFSPGREESWHRVDKSGATRAAVFGISDGLVSNTALVMGFAGAVGSGAGDSGTVIFAGLAGLLAGAFSMAAGEYVSVASQRDLFRRELEIEARELRDRPLEERQELELIYRAKGLSRAVAKATAEQIMSDPQMALETMAREELGLDPNELGSPIKAALSSFVAFAIGASVVVLPYLFASGVAALVAAIIVAATAMVVVGGVVGRMSGRGVVFSALRQLAWGAGAAIVTYGVGALIGVNVG